MSLRVSIDLGRVRRNAAEVAARAGVEVWATIKADAYGLGAARVAEALADVVAGFCVFALDEAVAIDLWGLTGKPAIALGPPTHDADAYLAAHVRPAVSTAEQAAALRAARPVLCVDTGMQRFACPPELVGEAVGAGGIDEAFTHATRAGQAARLVEIMSAFPGIKLHAAASSLLDEPDCRLDAVRPGMALYRGAVRATAPLVEARPSRGPIGYTGWASEGGRHGVIPVGYAHGLRPGPCEVNGRRQRIPEVGMQTAYVTLAADDRAGDEVVLLGDGVTEADVAFAWPATPHQVVLHLASRGAREYADR
ncbi:MAG TPA: alanine racemase [Tepidisphaeraceae bacterium]|nr:alanine racemase [Tepidisphaeraceae bacterium]